MTPQELLQQPREMQLQTFNTLTERCYQNSIIGGWHNDIKTGMPRSEAQNNRMVPTRLALIHSELSEGLEGDRKGLMDDKLMDRSMCEVELADAAIRIFDLAGCMRLELGDAIERSGMAVAFPMDWPFPFDDVPLGIPDYLAAAHLAVSRAFLCWTQNMPMTQDLSRAMQLIVLCAAVHDMDLFGAMHEKLAFNLQRMDHKREARMGHGGKSY